MGGDAEWGLDIMWHGLLLAANATANFWSTWSMQFLVVSSLVVQFALPIFAGFRCPGVRWVRKYIVWLLYVGGDYIATTALSSLTVSSASGVHQLVALWGAFFLLHLGGPDNISAYSLEDNELSWRKMLEWGLRFLGAFYVAYKSFSGGQKLVEAACVILFLVGVGKYLEKALALRRANLGNMRKSVKKQPRPEGFSIPGLQGDEALLMIAHNLFHICMRAMVDSSIMLGERPVADWKGLIELGWKDTCKVMEMELSLMYDILYTKAAVIHTWYGYCIRVLSPIATLIALVLFELNNEGGYSGADVMVTRILLVSTVFMETAWLLRALGSSWTVASLYRKQRRGWLSHAVLCDKRWHRFRRGLVSLRRFFWAERCREWSWGTIGQHNMLRLCTRDMKDRRCSLAKKMGVEWCKDEHYYWTQNNGHSVKDFVFKTIFDILKLEERTQVPEHSGRIDEKDPDPKLSVMSVAVVNSLGLFKAERGRRALKRMRQEYFDALDRYIRDEFHEQILIWHIATDVYLYTRNQAEDEETTQLVEAIKVLSNYMMFLLVERPYMLPGLVLRKLYEVTRCDMRRLWEICAAESNPAHQHNDRQKDLARFLKGKKKGYVKEVKLFKGKGLVLATKLANKLLELKDQHSQQQQQQSVPRQEYLNPILRQEHLDPILSLVFHVWLEMLLYASHRCSRESHAKQLSTVSSGAELATVVWLLAEHACLDPADKGAKKKLNDLSKTVAPSHFRNL